MNSNIIFTAVPFFSSRDFHLAPNPSFCTAATAYLFLAVSVGPGYLT